MSACTRCGREFLLAVNGDQVPEGILVEGEPACWACCVEAAEEIEAEHNP